MKSELLKWLNGIESFIQIKFYKKFYRYRKGHHWTTIGEKFYVNEEDYLKNKDEARRFSGKAFFGDLKKDYADYCIEKEIDKEKISPEEYEILRDISGENLYKLLQGSDNERNY